VLQGRCERINPSQEVVEELDRETLARLDVGGVGEGYGGQASDRVDGDIAMKDLEDEELDGVGGPQPAVAPPMAEGRAELDDDGRGKEILVIAFDSGECGSDIGHPWPPVRVKGACNNTFIGRRPRSCIIYNRL